MKAHEARPDPTWIAMLLFAAWRCADLLRTWRNDPAQTGSFVAFILWIGYVFVREREAALRPLVGWASLGLLLLLGGAVAELNVVEHGGMILVILSVVENRARRYRHLALSSTWLPAMAWVLKGSDPISLFALRMLPWVALLLVLGRRLSLSAAKGAPAS